MSTLVRTTLERVLCQRCSRCVTPRNTHGISYTSRNRATSSSLASKNDLNPISPDNQVECPNALERNKLQEYLNLVASSNELSAEDIERHRPSKYAPSGTSQYEADYEAIIKTLSRSFTAKQLKDGHRLFGLDLPRKKTKRELAISIIERQWRWPSLSESLNQRKDKASMTQSFPLSTREAFLLLGKDGSNLHGLSSKYNVQSSFMPNPLSLTVKGTRGSVGKVARYINAFKQAIAEDALSLPTGQNISPKLCQRVSRISGALVEGCDKSTFRIAYHNKEPHTRHVAKALMVQGAYEPLTHPSLFACVNKDYPPHLSPGVSESHGFSLYPFTPTHPLPWTVNSESMRRARSVGGWVDHNAIDKPTLLSCDNLIIGTSGHAEDIRKRLLTTGPDAFGGEKAIHVSLGHILLRSPHAPSVAFSPVGPFSPVELLGQIHNSIEKRVFMPSMPNRLLDLVPTKQRLIHRLVYRAVASSDSSDDLSNHTDFFKFEFGHALTAPQNHPEEDNSGEWDDSIPEDRESLDYRCWKGSQTKVDLMLPERAMDLRFSAVKLTRTPEPYWPQALRPYKDSLTRLSASVLAASREQLPLIIVCDDTTFVLRSSTLVRQSTDQHSIPGGNGSFPVIVNESVLNLNSLQRYVTCKMTCEQPSSDDMWRSLMFACDWLTAYEKTNISLNSR